MEDNFTPLLQRISEIKHILANYDRVTDPLEKELDELKFKTMQYMQATKNKRTEAVNGVYVIRSERKDFNITSEATIVNWLTNNDFIVEDYLKLDKNMVKETAKVVLEQNGELIPGTEETVKEYLTIKEVKK